MGTLIEHYAGAFPLWLAPVQAVLVPVREDHEPYCRGVLARLQAAGLRAEVDFSNETLGKKVRNAQTEKVPFVLVAGDKEVETGALTVRRYGQKEQTAMGVEDFLKLAAEEVERRSRSLAAS
jgi:threonyl-tRNA synthetase